MKKSFFYLQICCYVIVCCLSRDSKAKASKNVTCGIRPTETRTPAGAGRPAVAGVAVPTDRIQLSMPNAWSDGQDGVSPTEAACGMRLRCVHW